MTTTAHTTAPKPLYLHDGGEVTCADDGGYTLKAEVTARPNGKVYRTPRGTWTRVTAADVAEWNRQIAHHDLDLGPMSCDYCAAPALTA